MTLDEYCNLYKKQKELFIKSIEDSPDKFLISGQANSYLCRRKSDGETFSFTDKEHPELIDKLKIYMHIKAMDQSKPFLTEIYE